MDAAGWHAVFLVASTFIALLVMAFSWRQLGKRVSGDEPTRVNTPGRLLRVCWPFLAIGCLESLVLNAFGTLTVEWLVPGIVVLLAGLLGYSSRFVKRMRWTMLVLSIALTIQGNDLLSHSYTTRPLPFLRGVRVERRWYTAITGMMRVERPLAQR